MKLISLYEPWATLMALGVKKIETRSWPTSYRGWLAIQASKGGLTMSELEHTCWEPPFREALEAEGEIYSWMHQIPSLNGNTVSARRWQDRGAFPFGKIVAVARLVDCRPAKTFTNITSEEYAFGNYDGDRFGWQTDYLFRLPEPIPFRAKQGLCDVPDAVVQQIREQFKGGAI